MLGVREDIKQLMSDFSVLVFCSESEGGGPPWAILEAMSERLPIVASDIEGVRPAIEDGKTGLRVKVGDLEGYANALRFMFQHPDEANKMAQNARLLVEQSFTAKVMAEQIADCYRDIMRRKSKFVI